MREPIQHNACAQRRTNSFIGAKPHCLGNCRICPQKNQKIGDIYPQAGDIYTCFNLDSPIYHNKLLSGNGKSVRVRPNLFIYKQLYAKSINRTIILDMPKSGSLWLLYGHIKQFGKVV